MYTQFSVLKIIIVLVVCVGTTWASDSHDYALWTSGGASAKISKKISASAKVQLRLKDNVSAIDQYFGDIAVGYEFFKMVEVGTSLRFARDNDNAGAKQGYENILKYSLIIATKNKLGNLSIKNRLKIQNKLNMTNTGEDYFQYFRFKTSLGYGLKEFGLSPGISAEVYYPYYAGANLDRLRLGIGTGYKLNKKIKIGFEYRYETDLNTDAAKTTDIFIISYSHSFKLYNKKK